MPEDHGTEPLFEMEPTPKPKEERQRSPRSQAFAWCPDCATRTMTGLILSDSHLVWRAHAVTTWSGAVRPCRAEGAPVCETGVRGAQTITCKCGKSV